MKPCDVDFIVKLSAALLSGETPTPEDIRRLEEIALRERNAKCPFCSAGRETEHIGCPYKRD